MRTLCGDIAVECVKHIEYILDAFKIQAGGNTAYHAAYFEIDADLTSIGRLFNHIRSLSLSSNSLTAS
ncbi:MAG: hypothetical protein LBR16_02370 [Treponema sp.]|jgi:hypothetical protein|nr:hypothetical protein [Treponema sp.]